MFVIVLSKAERDLIDVLAESQDNVTKLSMTD